MATRTIYSEGWGRFSKAGGNTLLLPCHFEPVFIGEESAFGPKEQPILRAIHALRVTSLECDSFFIFIGAIRTKVTASRTTNDLD